MTTKIFLLTYLHRNSPISSNIALAAWYYSQPFFCPVFCQSHLPYLISFAANKAMLYLWHKPGIGVAVPTAPNPAVTVMSLNVLWIWSIHWRRRNAISLQVTTVKLQIAPKYHTKIKLRVDVLNPSKLSFTLAYQMLLSTSNFGFRWEKPLQIFLFLWK